ncbi:unnamed protein product [marine sediment metagenome]|uniref:Uncharacterized protein n=1 Tax=marine sediment metagenome TaxID=412755 RepID=X1TBI9_9ZZZZ
MKEKMEKIKDHTKGKSPTTSFLIEIFSDDNGKIEKIRKYLKELKLKFDITILKNY